MTLAEIITRGIDRFHTGPLARLVPLNIFRYAVCGGMNMALDLVWYHFIYHVVVAERYVDIGFSTVSPHVASLAVVFPITFFNGFWLNRNIAFRGSRRKTRTQLLRYLLSVAGAIALNYLCMKIFVDALHFWPTPSKLLTTVVFLATMLSVPLTRLSEILLFALYPLLTAPLGGMRYGTILRRSLYVVPFAALIGVFNLFCDHQPALRIGTLAVTEGWVVFVSFCCAECFRCRRCSC